MRFASTCNLLTAGRNYSLCGLGVAAASPPSWAWSTPPVQRHAVTAAATLIDLIVLEGGGAPEEAAPCEGRRPYKELLFCRISGLGGLVCGATGYHGAGAHDNYLSNNIPNDSNDCGRRRGKGPLGADKKRGRLGTDKNGT